MIHYFFASCQTSTGNGLICADSLPSKSPTLTLFFNVAFAVLGALAFLMIVIGGLRYILAQGDANKISESKRMIAYALVGLIVAALAAAIVNFVLGSAK